MKCPKCGYEKEKFKKWNMSKILKDARIRLKNEIGFGIPIKKEK